mmetsp:Transcript_40371/g.72494  ORF Transcript_40371/g.72494 Transcript_40371/m.72494 type:complete len:569 (+) Transcript_40371:85-1791(+)
MALFDRFVAELDALASKSSEAEAEAVALAKSFLESSSSEVRKALERFGADGRLVGGLRLPASAYNDFYKWTMLPVERAVERGTGGVHCTFSANVRDQVLSRALLESARQTPPTALFEALKDGLQELATRQFDRVIFEKLRADASLPGWGDEVLDAVCGIASAPRTLAQEVDISPTGSRRPPKAENEVFLQVFTGHDVKLSEDRVYIEATGPWHLVTWLETTLMQVIYETFFRARMRERFACEDATWYPKWMAEAFLRCARSTLAANGSGLRGAVFTGRRTGGLAWMMLQNLFIQKHFRDDSGASMCLGTSSVTAFYWLQDAGVPAEMIPKPAGTHAHELSMVLSGILGEIDDKAGMPLSQVVGHTLYFLLSRPQGDVQEPARKPMMPMLPDTLGTVAFMRTAELLKVPAGVHKGEPVLSIIGAARQDSGTLDAYAKIMKEFSFTGGLMASEIEVAQNLLDAKANGYSTFGAGGFFGDSEKAWNETGSNISMAIKVLCVYVAQERTAVDPVKTGDPTGGGEGKFEADGLISPERLSNLKSRVQRLQKAEAALSSEDLQKIFESSLQRFL